MFLVYWSLWADATFQGLKLGHWKASGENEMVLKNLVIKNLDVIFKKIVTV